MHLVDTNAVTWKFIVGQETIGNKVNAANPSILPEATCLERVYTIESVKNEKDV